MTNYTIVRETVHMYCNPDSTFTEEEIILLTTDYRYCNGIDTVEAEFDTLEEAKAYMQSLVDSHCVRSYVDKVSNGLYHLEADVYAIMENEYDDNGDFIEAYLVDSFAMPIKKED